MKKQSEYVDDLANYILKLDCTNVSIKLTIAHWLLDNNLAIVEVKVKEEKK